MFKPFVTSLAAVALLAGTAAFAQSPPPRGAMKDRAGWHAQRQADRLAQLKAQLKITAAQEPAWNGFVSALQSMHPKWPKRAMKSKTGGLTPAPQVFDTLAEYAQKRAESARAVAGAVKKLYEQLTPVQRAVLDTHLAERHRYTRHRYYRNMNRQAPRNAPPPPESGSGNGGR